MTRLQVDIQTTILEGAMEDSALAEKETETTGWSAPELLRITGKARLSDIEIDRRDKAESNFLRSFDVARAQGPLAWELHTAMSLASLWRHQNRTPQAYELLNDLYERFAEGHRCRDMTLARELLDNLSTSSKVEAI